MKPAIITISLALCITRSVGQPICDFRGRDSLKVKVSDDTVSIWDFAACAYCCETFTAFVSRSADSIFINQVDSSGLKCTCACIYDLKTSIVGLPAGTYWAVINRDYGPPNHTRKYVVAIRFEISSTSSGTLSSKAIQSGCIADAVQKPLFEFPIQFALLENYPNPFNPRTTLRYQIMITEFVSMKVYDLLGREVQTLVEQTKPPGFYVATFDAPAEASSGIYFCRMVAGQFVQTRTMILIRTGGCGDVNWEVFQSDFTALNNRLCAIATLEVM